MTMYLEHFGLAEAPFKITPHTEFFFSGANRGETLEALLYAITSGEGIVKVAGEVGSGKTMLCRVLMERLPETVETIYLAVPSLSRDEMLATISSDLGLEVQGLSTTKLIRLLQDRLIDIHAEGRQVVALVDEAHAMPLETLEEIRLLSNLETSHSKLLQIVLFGQPELDEHLALPNMRQLKERITHHFNLKPLPPRDIKDYVDFRVRAAGYKGPDLFSAEVLKLIADASEGLTRRINIYCDKTLLAAFADGTHTITTDHVRAAIADTQIVLPQASTRKGTLWLAVAAAAIAGLVIGFFAGRFTASPLETTASVTSKASPKDMAGIDAKAPPVATAATTVPPASIPNVANAAPAPPTATSAAPATSAAAPNATPESNKQTPDNTGVGSQNWLEKRVNADVSRLGKVSPERFVIQLMTADERERNALEGFLRVINRDLNADRIMLYPSGTKENPKLSVLYGNYADRAEASAELSGLPTKLTVFRPYVRSIQAVKDDLRRLP
jgi:MSHA biogenesis protein MshM